MDIQPDQKFNATETTYIAGGSNANTNFSSSSSIKTKYDPSNESNQSLAYIKFDFSAISGSTCDAAKIRIFVNNMDSGTCNLRLYGITNDSWNASAMTWNSGAPNHTGYNITGSGYYDLGLTPSYDPVNQVGFYDFDVTDFLKNHCYGDKKASFILRADTSNSVGVSIDSALRERPPQLVISRADVWDYTWVDKVIGWAEAANLKLELLWFGSDTTKECMDHRVPYYVIRNYQKQIHPDGRIDLQYKQPLDTTYVYVFRMCKNDTNLRAMEYTALKNLFNHVAVYNSSHGNKKTVVGCQITNEPICGFHDYRCYCPLCNARYTAGGYSSQNIFKYDVFWDYAQNLGKAVKDSNYPVWTRINFHTFEADFVYRNENLKASGGTTYVDFVGYDPYIGTVDEGFRYGLGLWYNDDYLFYNYGKNLPMIMETSGTRTNSDYLNLATLAGGAYYNIYNFMANDGNDLYKNGPNNVPVSNNSNLSGIVNTNNWLKKIWFDLATKLPDAAGGEKLAFFNEHANTSDSVTKKVSGLDINYTTSNKGVGIAFERAHNTLVLASKTASAFTLKNLLAHSSVITVTTGYYNSNNSWVVQGSKSYTTDNNDVIINMNEYEVVHVYLNNGSIPARSVNYSVNDEFNGQTTGSAPSGWTINTSQGTVSIAESPGLLDKSVRVNRTSSSSGQTFAEKSFTPVSGVVTVEARVRAGQTNKWFGAPYLYDSSGNVLFSLAFDASGNIAYRTSSSWTAIKTYSNRAWYWIKAVINTDTDRYDLYINGVKRLSQEPLRQAVSNIAKIRFYAENATTGYIDFDKVKIYKDSESSPPAVITYYPAADSYVRSGSNANKNYGTASVLESKNDPTFTSSRRIAYIKFDYSDISSINSAVLKFTTQGTVTNHVLHVYGLTNTSWTETGITWNNAPNNNTSGYGLTGSGITDIGTVTNNGNGIYTINVTNYVKSQAGKIATFVILTDTPDDALVDSITSREGTNKPVLEIQ